MRERREVVALGQDLGQLREHEDEDEVEEQLERRDPLAALGYDRGHDAQSCTAWRVGAEMRGDTIRDMDRFDDVETRIVEEPSEPPRRASAPRRLGPAVLAVVASVALTGSLAAGASALTSTAQAPTRAVEKFQTVNQQGHRAGKRDGLCHKGEGHRRDAAAAVGY